MNRFNHTRWMTVVTPTGSPKAVPNGCVTDNFGDVFVLSLDFHFLMVRGFSL